MEIVFDIETLAKWLLDKEYINWYDVELLIDELKEWKEENNEEHG